MINPLTFLVTKPILGYVFVGVLGALLLSSGTLYLLLRISHAQNETLALELQHCRQNVDNLLEHSTKKEDYMRGLYDVLKRHYDTLPKPPNDRNVPSDPRALDESLRLRYEEHSSGSPDGGASDPSKD